jgi:signal transduction histidine kinase
MHPILASGRRRLIYLAAWVPFAGALAALLIVFGGLRAAAAALVALPVSLFYAAVCLGTYYLCRARPLRLAEIPRVVGTHLAAAAFSAALAAGVAGLLARALPLVGLAAVALPRPAAVVFSVGLLLFLLAAALYYALLGYEGSRAAERRALEFQLLSRDAELRALRAQIHPHFLFNALNSISALTSRDPAAARRVCLMLGDFLRKSLTLGAAEAIPLGEELALAETLLSVERVRFGARLELAFDIAEGAGACLVPPLILQPLVENAVGHGIAPLRHGGTVRIAARCGDGMLVVEVADDGRGLPPGRDPVREGHGLANVRQRLLTLYGEGGGLDLGPGQGGRGTMARIRIPAPGAAAGTVGAATAAGAS